MTTNIFLLIIYVLVGPSILRASENPFQEELAPVLRALEHLELTAHDKDVHSMTVTFGKTHYPTLRGLITKRYPSFLPQPTQTIHQIKSEISDFASTFPDVTPIPPLAPGKKPWTEAELGGFNAQRKHHLQRGLSHLEAYWNLNDHETTYVTGELATIAWNMAKAFDRGDGNPTRWIFLDSLASNTETGGGCHPGVNGRLILLIARFLSSSP